MLARFEVVEDQSIRSYQSDDIRIRNIDLSETDVFGDREAQLTLRSGPCQKLLGSQFPAYQWWEGVPGITVSYGA